MDRDGFRRFLEGVILESGVKYTENGIKARVSKASAVENKLNVDLDIIVQSIEETRKIRDLIYENFPSKPGNYYNAVTRYFWFRNGFQFEE